jgi:hypothetical protein
MPKFLWKKLGSSDFTLLNMTFLVQHIRSGEFARRPQPLDLAPGQLAVNYNTDSTGLFFRTDNGELVKAGPVHVGADAPPQINYTERSVGEMWLDTTDPISPSMRVYTQAGWTVVNVLDGTITEDKLANEAVTPAKIKFNNTLFPTVDNQFDIGSPARRLANLYTRVITTGDLNLKSEAGDWAVIEQNDFIKLRNNRTGQEFKIVMEAL